MRKDKDAEEEEELTCSFFHSLYIGTLISTIEPCYNFMESVIYVSMLSSWMGHIWHKIPNFTQLNHRPWANLVKPLALVKLNHII